VKIGFMKGVTILTDEKKRRKIVQVDIKEIARNPDEFEDLIDVLVAESRRNESKVSFEAVKKNLKKKREVINSGKHLFCAALS